MSIRPEGIKSAFFRVPRVSLKGQGGVFAARWADPFSGRSQVAAVGLPGGLCAFLAAAV